MERTGVTEHPVAIRCARCGRDWTAELEARLHGAAGDFWQVMCSCGAQLYAEGTGTGIHLLAGLERRRA
jgi:hypothetical protein